MWLVSADARGRGTRDELVTESAWEARLLIDTCEFGANINLPDCMRRKLFQIFLDMEIVLLLPV